jgi:hypothetical protein
MKGQRQTPENYRGTVVRRYLFTSNNSKMPLKRLWRTQPEVKILAGVLNATDKTSQGL